MRTAAARPQLTGPWDMVAVDSFLTHEVIPLRLATIGRTGATVQSAWFDYQDGFIWCSTQSDSVLLRRLRHDPRAGFEVAPDAAPYHGVRGRAIADIVHIGAAELLDRLVERYVADPSSNMARWMRSRRTTEVALRLNPLTMHSWDNSARLS
jgi:hypothetical protein